MNSILTEKPNGDHVMLLYSNEQSRTNAAVGCISDALKNGAFCVYASVDAFSSWRHCDFGDLVAKITNYRNNLDEGNLEIINFRPYYESALDGKIFLFKELKSRLEKVVLQRKNEGKLGKIVVYADAACELSRNKKFIECEALEKWWSEAHADWVSNNLDISVVCPHPGIILGEKSAEYHKHMISSYHTKTLMMQESFPFTQETVIKEIGRPIRILIAESEPDIRSLYNDYLMVLGFDAAVVENAQKCLDLYVTRDGDFDLIMLDNHLTDIPIVEVAKEILNHNPSNRLVLTTTNTYDETITDLLSLGINSEDILLKPFKLSTLLSVIKRASPAD
jgi:CheY-like chemotaxis protein